MMYESIPPYNVKRITFIDGIANLNSIHKIFSWNMNEEIHMPAYIELQNKSGFMKLREKPLVLRIYKYNRKNNPHEFFYSELLLYKPWRNEETDLHLKDIESCLVLFNETEENE